MSTPSLWERLRRARIVQVLAVYFGASWLVLQVADTLVDALELPAWVIPVALILLLIGLLVILATAWVQSHPQTAAREESGEVPGDWQLAPRDAIASLRRGRMPHLTWGRAIAGGVVALSVLFGAAGIYVGVTGNRFPIGPAEATATEAAEGIAVVPFDVRGADLEIWREGMMDLLANGLDGIGGYRTIDSRTLMARWQAEVGETDPDLRTTLAIGRAVGARYVMEGSVVGLADNVRLVANVYDLDTEQEVASAQAEGPAADVLRLVDELAVAVMRDLLSAVGQGGEADFTAETITTSSLPALRAFLEGEGHYRKGNFADAVAAYERAVAADSTFAIALVRLSEGYGWLESQNSERMREVGERAMAHADRLSPRYQFIMEGWDALNHGSAVGVASLREAVQKYPDDPEAWFLLAETYIHVGGATYGTQEELWEALQRATTLDPNFAPYLVHVADLAVVRGDRQSAEQAIARYESLTGNRDGLEYLELAIPLVLGDEAEVRAALAAAEQATPRTLDLLWATFAVQQDHFDRSAAIDEIFARKTEQNRVAFQGWFAGSMGQVARGAEIMRDPAVSAANRTVFLGHVSMLWNVDPAPGELDPATCEQEALNGLCILFLGTTAARLGQWELHAAALRRTRAEAAGLAAEDSVLADRYAAAADVIEGAAAWRRGDVARARTLLEARSGTLGNAAGQARLELAWLELAGGRHALALRHFRSLLETFQRPLALYSLATMYEQLGQPEEALRYWASFVTMTEDGDDLPRIREGREALARLTREPGASR